MINHELKIDVLLGSPPNLAWQYGGKSAQKLESRTIGYLVPHTIVEIHLDTK